MFAAKDWVFLHNNALVHWPLLVQQHLTWHSTVMFPRSWLSPDLTPCDYYLSVDECPADGVELKAVLKYPTSYYFLLSIPQYLGFMQQQPHNHEIISESLLILRFRDCFNNIFMMNIFHICTFPLPWTWYSLKLLSSCMYVSSHYADLEWFFMVSFAMVKENWGVSDSITHHFLGIWLTILSI